MGAGQAAACGVHHAACLQVTQPPYRGVSGGRNDGHGHQGETLGWWEVVCAGWRGGAGWGGRRRLRRAEGASAVVSPERSPACFAKRRNKRLTATGFSQPDTASRIQICRPCTLVVQEPLLRLLPCLDPQLALLKPSCQLCPPLVISTPRLLTGTVWGSAQKPTLAKFLSLPNRIWSFFTRQYSAARTAVPPFPPFSKTYICPEPSAFPPHTPDSMTVVFFSREVSCMPDVSVGQ